MPQIGARVGAILKANKEEVELLGYGEYVGDLPCPMGPMGMSLEELYEIQDEMKMERRPMPNPCIKLDNGKYIWGMQCWWGSEEQVQKMIGDRKVKQVELESLEPLEISDV